MTSGSFIVIKVTVAVEASITCLNESTLGMEHNQSASYIKKIEALIITVNIQIQCAAEAYKPSKSIGAMVIYKYNGVCK